jgi:hypothetical protein
LPPVTPRHATAHAATGFDRHSAEDRSLLVSYLLHCADLCNPLFPPAMSRRIADDLGREFAAQAAKERAAGMPVTVMLASDDVARGRMEASFIEYVGACPVPTFPQNNACTAQKQTHTHHDADAADPVAPSLLVRPLYATLARVSPGMGSRCLALIDANRAAWAALAAKGGGAGA